MKNLQRFLPFAAVFSLSLTGVAIAQSPIPLGLSPTTPNFLLSIRREGAMCAAMGCYSEVAVLSNGTYRYADSWRGQRTDRQRTGRLARGEVRRFQQRIANTNFEAIKARPFAGTCPTAFDGPETVYTFRIGDRVEVLRSCQTHIEGSNPLFQQAERVYCEVSKKAASSS